MMPKVPEEFQPKWGVKPRRKDLNDCTTPIWNQERGYRLSIVRKMKGITQAELAKDLGTTQTIISKIESGRLAVPQAPFSVNQLMGVFPNDVSYILAGHNEEKYPWGLAALRRIRGEINKQNNSNNGGKNETVENE